MTASASLPIPADPGPALSRHRPSPNGRNSLLAALFGVDGVLIDSPHGRAWREALEGFADSRRLTTALYQSHVAGKPRLPGARAVLDQVGVPDAARLAALYAARKQARIGALIETGQFASFADALRFLQAGRARGICTAAVSSSKNANPMMERIHLAYAETLLNSFSANLCGQDVPRGKPDPAIFLLAAATLGIAAASCLVVEDAPAGIEAAKAGGAAALSVARLGELGFLCAAVADLIVTSLDHLEVEALGCGELRTRAAEER